MLDLASMVFGDFQDNIIATFGEDIGWLVGHLLLLGIAATLWLSWSNRDHIRTQSGWNKSTLTDLATIGALTLAQYVIFTGTFGFPIIASIGLAFAFSLCFRGLINTVNG